MTQPAKAQEPTMEEILASIRRIIADDDSGKAVPKAADPLPPPPTPVAQRPDPVPPLPPRAAPVAPPSEPAMRQAEIDAMLSNLNTAPPRPATPVPPAPDVLELTESMATGEPPPPQAVNGGFRTIDGQSDVFFEERPPDNEPAYEPAADPRATLPDQEALISSATTAAVDSAFNSLAHTVLVQNARTLEDLVREMLRPLLKTWLDDNLPKLVERLVRAEIERVSRGRNN
jgi:cell pole-organizing protein PopZ